MTDHTHTTTSRPTAAAIGFPTHLLKRWFAPRSQNRDEAFRERTVRITLFFSTLLISLSFLASLLIFQDPWGVISFPSIHVFLLILCVVSAYFIARGEIITSSLVLVLAIYVGAVGLNLLARQEGSVLRFLTGIPTFMFPPLVAALLFPRNTIIPISVGSAILYLVSEMVIPVRPDESSMFDTSGLIGVLMILMLGEGVILRQLRTEFDARLDALRISVRQAETARQQAETERLRAEEADKAKSQFLANMSHELRTPLNAIIGYDEAMLGGMAGTFSDQQTRLLGNIQLNSRRLLTLINDILDLSKVEAGALEVYNMPISPRKVITESVESLRALAQQKGIALEATFTEGVPEVILADSKKVQQILVNLIGNAIKFTSQGGVYVDVDIVDKPNWKFSVRDTGIGIPEDALGYIFDPFRQVDNTDTRMHKGTGLGLSIVKKLVESMNGTISVTSAVGSGTTFTVTMPRVNIPEAVTGAVTETVTGAVAEKAEA
jgi:signal transduction histidine kinase